jgi:hypothetical protein
MFGAREKASQMSINGLSFTARILSRLQLDSVEEDRK